MSGLPSRCRVSLETYSPQGLAYFTHTLDRANLGNAKTGSFEKDLHLVGNQFNLLLVLFYVPYALFNIPWSILAKRYNSKVIIPCTIAIWGICTLASVATQSFGAIMATRIIMGAAEAAYKPCEVYYLSLFYTRKEMALRVSWIGQMGFIAGAVSGLISWSVFQWKGHLKVSSEFLNRSCCFLLTLLPSPGLAVSVHHRRLDYCRCCCLPLHLCTPQPGQVAMVHRPRTTARQSTA